MNGLNNRFTDNNSTIAVEPIEVECIVCLQNGISSWQHAGEYGYLHRICDVCLPILQDAGMPCPHNCGATLARIGRPPRQDQEELQNNAALREAVGDAQVYWIADTLTEIQQKHRDAKRPRELTDEQREKLVKVRKILF